MCHVNEAFQEGAIPNTEPRLVARIGNLLSMSECLRKIPSRSWTEPTSFRFLVVVVRLEDILGDHDYLVIELLEVKCRAVLDVIVILHSQESGKAGVHVTELSTVCDRLIERGIEYSGAQPLVIRRLLDGDAQFCVGA